MTKKSITQQLEETKNEIDKLENEKRQLNNQMHKIQARENEKERKARTRKLIEKGAILESINSDMAQLEGAYLKKFLKQVFLHERPEEYAKIILKQQNDETTQ